MLIFMKCLDLDSLRAFLAVVEASSFSRAAEAVGRSQSAVSLQLGRLERLLGKVLIRRRQGRVLGLTEDGRELLSYARRMIDLNDAAYRALAPPAAAGRVRLGVPADFMEAAFPDMLRSFQHAHGGVELEVVSDVSERLRERVRQGTLDLACFKRHSGRDGGTVISIQPLVWVGGTLGVVPDGGAPLPLVLFPDGCVFRARALEALEAAGRCWRVVYVSPSFESVRAALRAGLGLGVLPAGATSRGLAQLDEAGLPRLGEVELVMATGRNNTRAVRVLADHIARHVRESRS